MFPVTPVAQSAAAQMADYIHFKIILSVFADEVLAKNNEPF